MSASDPAMQGGPSDSGESLSTGSGEASSFAASAGSTDAKAASPDPPASEELLADSKAEKSEGSVEGTARPGYLYFGLGVVALVLLMYEVLLTRIFSVTLWYHFAFMAISIAMFGTTVGTMIVYAFPKSFPPARATEQLSTFSLLLAASIVATAGSFALIPHLTSGMSTENAWLASIAISYPLMAIPFLPGGIILSLALTKASTRISKLYAADLLGAACGCIAIIVLLNVTDALTAIFVLASAASLAAYAFAEASKKRTTSIMSALVCCILLAVSAFHTVLVREHRPLISLTYVKGGKEITPLFEKWNSFSRIAVLDNMPDSKPTGWGLSPTIPDSWRSSEHLMLIDGSAGTQLIKYNGKPDSVEFLKYDITNLAHVLRPDSNVLVIGVGGGRDILSAIAFNQRSVTGVEINENILNTVSKTYGDFTGHLDRIPGVKFINDEARGYVTRSNEKFDIIQVSLVDTFAATQSGALALTENSLYTKEAWKTFVDHLTSRGVLTFSRWYHKDHPYEMQRLASLANEALLQCGVKEPREHIIIANVQASSFGPERGVATIIVSKSPLSPADRKLLGDYCQSMKFDLLVDPSSDNESLLAKLLSGKDAHRTLDNLPVDLSAPSDDRPYFFQSTKVTNAFAGMVDYISSPQKWFGTGVGVELRALFMLLMLVGILNLLCIFVPLARTKAESPVRSKSLLAHFMFIGLGFMFIEVSQMQTLNLLLGNPVLSLSVVLFTLLLSGGLGSLHTSKILAGSPEGNARYRLGWLLLLISATGLITPVIQSVFHGTHIIVLILMALIMVAPMGFAMGMAFPMGIQLAVRKGAFEALPWLWGLNGAASVFASVISILISLTWGISVTFWCGFSCYLLATVAYLWADNASMNWTNVSPGPSSSPKPGSAGGSPASN